jgi:hypothetical protein
MWDSRDLHHAGFGLGAGRADADRLTCTPDRQAWGRLTG